MKAWWIGLVWIFSFIESACAEDSPESKALAYLSAEVPRWSPEHHCFSCHNNGDAARALYAAVRFGRDVPVEATLDTDRWLASPELWDKNGGDGPFSDKILARLQFTSALASAIEAGRIADRAPLLRAAARLIDDQAEDGSWKVEDDDRVGTPATYGRPLATWIGRETLRIADASKYRPQIEKADTWLRRQTVERVLEASTILLARAFDASTEGLARRDKTLELLKRSQAKDGGWGPYVRSPTEAFDTALALLALDRYRDQTGVDAMIQRGRAYLIETQQEDGSWVETTRPTGGESYAQRISTTGWATLALLKVTIR